MELTKTKKLIILGDSAFAEIAYEYFLQDTEYEPIAFSVESSYLKKEKLLELPVVPFEELDTRYNPQNHFIFVAITYTQLNRLRTRLVKETKAKGYSLASYISPRAFVWSNVQLGEHCFIFEDNTIQPFVNIGNNVILWSGNHIGHHSEIKDNCFISSHVVISGFCHVNKNCFLGVNSTIANNVIIEKDNWIGPGVVIHQNTQIGEIYSPNNVQPSKVSSYRFFKVKKDEME